MRSRFVNISIGFIFGLCAMTADAQVEIVGDAELNLMLRQRVASADTVDLLDIESNFFLGITAVMHKECKVGLT